MVQAHGEAALSLQLMKVHGDAEIYLQLLEEPPAKQVDAQRML